MKPRRNEEAQAHIGLSSHKKKIQLINISSRTGVPVLVDVVVVVVGGGGGNSSSSSSTSSSSTPLSLNLRATLRKG
jgi:hypothetical protein